MLHLDHITIIAPTLEEGAEHVRNCLDIEVPFGTRHLYMGTHNHRLQLGDRIYLEIVALDPKGTAPGRARWFGLDDQRSVRKDWESGRRLRGWVANISSFRNLPPAHRSIFGEETALPVDTPGFSFSIPQDGSLPLDGAAPSLIDHWGNPTAMADIPDLGARLRAFSLEHPEPEAIGSLYRDLQIGRQPSIAKGAQMRYEAMIETAAGMRTLT